MNIAKFLKTHPKPWSNLDGEHIYDATEHYVNVDQLLEYIGELEEVFKETSVLDFSSLWEPKNE